MCFFFNKQKYRLIQLNIFQSTKMDSSNSQELTSNFTNSEHIASNFQEELTSPITNSEQILEGLIISSRTLTMEDGLILLDWFKSDVMWGSDSALISDALGLYSYQTNHRYQRSKTGSGTWSIVTECQSPGCTASFKFTKSKTTHLWTSRGFSPHCESCIEGMSNPAYLADLWKTHKTQTLVSYRLLAQLCRRA